MASYPEEFNYDRLRKLDPYTPVEETLGQWRQIGRSWSRSLIAARHCRQDAQHEAYKSYVRQNGIDHYVDTFATVARTVAKNHAAIELSHVTLDNYLTAEDAALIDTINTHLGKNKLDPLSSLVKRKIILPFVDPDGQTFMPDIDHDPLSEGGALDLYRNQLMMRADLLLDNDTQETEAEMPKPRRTLRTLLGAVSIGSVLSLGYYAKRRL